MLKPFYHKKNCLSSLLAPCCAPFFVKRNPLAFFFSSFAGKLTSRGSRRRQHDAPHHAKSLFWSIEKQGFVLAFCKAIRVKYFYALQKPSVYAQRFVASNNATHSCDKSHNRWLCPLRSISANASACFSLRLRSAAKNDAPCRFLNALVQIPVVKCRKTKTDKRVCLSVISIGETGICSCLLQSNLG